MLSRILLSRILLAVSDRQCAQAAFETLRALSEYPAYPESEVVVLGIVQPFRTIYAHKHPLIGRRIRNLLWQVNSSQADGVHQLVREAAASFESLGWQVRREVREGEISDEILQCCRAVCPRLLVVGSCLRNALTFWPSRGIWQHVMRGGRMLRHGGKARRVGHLTRPYRGAAGRGSRRIRPSSPRDRAATRS